MNMLALMAAAGLLAAAALALARALPAQNVALIMGGLIVWEVALETVWNGRCLLRSGLLYWPAITVLARVGCRWILRRRRQDWNYGIWLIFMASMTVALAQLAIALAGSTWAIAAKLAAIRFASTAACLVFLSPWFISKFPQQPKKHAQ
jgi:hypothetical protein